MKDNASLAIDLLISNFENNTYTEKHISSLLDYLVGLKDNEDIQTVESIIKVLGYCTKDFVKENIVNTINNPKTSHKIKKALISVCWESGIDYSDYLFNFVQYLSGSDESIAIEAYTVINEMGGRPKDLEKSIEHINNTNQESYTPTHRILINDSLQHLITLL
ncbi:MAG: hypothetical protein IT238_10295 [Bacteroidia bacterium]|nr:hypothetical protein [Bacteroidia bacterium]MCZ2247978.1 hypothetical protein [Bacteroidia bacterium]